MWLLQLFVSSCVLTCFRLSDARFLGVGSQSQWGVEEAVLDAEPERGNSRQSARGADGVYRRRRVEPLFLDFPEDLEEPEKELRENKLPEKELSEKERPQLLKKKKKKERVAVRCGDSRIQVEVSQDLLGLGRRIKPEDLTLGGCSATEIDDSAHVLAFESELHGCGSRLVMMENSFIYAFTLVYEPRESGRGGITRSQSAVIRVECHYPR
ncbi:uncharacterized protein LOC141798165 [Halichoeres trimaculatus]|uniref:uncharacterized protein LOC141798165 n=1 Tax=Halichoeres trimaculatus TaxID=147232 RepID=UPI003D9F7004